MIYTFTLNPAIDYFLTIRNDLMVDEVNRGTDAIYKAGGKGLNVSKILSLLDIPSKAVALLGGFTGDFIRQETEKNENIEVIAVEVEGVNRINLKAHYDQKALCINAEGPTVSQKNIEELYRIVSELNDEDIVMLNGSMMKGLDDDFLIAFCDRVHDSGAKLVIDMESLTPELLKRCRPDLIKPNLYELRLLMNDPSITKDNAEEALAKLRREGISMILLSLGKDGALLADKEGFLYLTHPDNILVNKVGAGDAMLAGFIGRYSETKDRETALVYAGACGNAVASRLEDITKETIEEFLPLMSVRY